MSVKIPADVDRPDKILYGLTFRQVVILGGTGAVLLWALLTLGAVVPFPVLIGLLLPVAAGGCVLAVARRDGMSLDRFALAAADHLRQPRNRIASGEEVEAPPSWCRMRGRLPAPLRLPVRAVRSDGAMELAEGGTAVIVRAGTVAFGLRTPGEQASLVAVFGRWLNSLDAPVQIVVQARPVDLSGLAEHLTGHAPELPDPALEQAAIDHATFLTELGGAHELLVRQVLIVITDTTQAQPTGGMPWLKARRERAARDAGAAVALRRAEEAVHALTALGVTAEVLDADACTAVLADFLSPGEPPPVDNAAPDEVITGKEMP
ncbi:PrgI family protein [Actinomadura sp. WAC 06369]|uniref:PrgI family protein n=1 Tax=Actinomadura sp. WAC 06369 TaxID=2203193 RepID=UPI0013155700|nr:PrgI family protein [Actinomadura sp. WAC 06369]